MTLRQAAQQALKSMDDHMYRADTHEFYEAKEALRAALAEPPCKTGASCTNKCQRCAEPEQPQAYWLIAPNGRWYKNPKHPMNQDKKAEPEQEPVAWIDINDSGQILNEPRLWSEGNRDEVPLYTAPTPRNEPVIDKTMAKRIATQLGWEPPRKPLTDEEIDNICKSFRLGYTDTEFARAIERAHGIKENRNE